MNETKEKLKEQTFIITTFIDDCTEATLRQHVQHNCSVLKDKLNQEARRVEISKPEVMFL